VHYALESASGYFGKVNCLLESTSGYSGKSELLAGICKWVFGKVSCFLDFDLKTMIST
jgi:hypothetical protein